MQTSAETVYLDSSALVKLAIPEAESESLRHFLGVRPRATRVSSSLARVEVVRAVLRHGPEAVERAREVVQRLRLLRIDNSLLDQAAELQPITLRSLDAIHLAAALTLGSALSELVTYDRRMAEAAQILGLPTVAPGATPGSF